MESYNHRTSKSVSSPKRLKSADNDKRRTTRRIPRIASAAEKPRQTQRSAAFQSQNSGEPITQPVNAPQISRPSCKGTTQEESRLNRASGQSLEPGKKAAIKPAIAKRDQSNIFKSFSKPKAKLETENTNSLIGSGVATADDSVVQMTSVMVAMH